MIEVPLVANPPGLVIVSMLIAFFAVLLVVSALLFQRASQ